MPTRPFADDLRTFLEREGLSQAALARRLDVSQNAISQYVTGKVMPSRGVLLRLQEIADGDLKVRLKKVLSSGDVKLRTRADRIERKLSSAEDFDSVVGVWRSARKALLSSLVDLFTEGADERIEVVVAHLLKRSSDPEFGPVLDRIVAVLEGGEPPEIQREESEIVDLVRRFDRVTDEPNREILMSHLRVVVANGEKKRQGRTKKAG